MKRIDVTPAEMLQLREQGLSNHDIAKSLDISYASVVRRIGKQSGRMERLAAFADKPVQKDTQDEKCVSARYDIRPTAEWFKVGNYFRIELDHEARTISINKELVFEYDKLPDLVQFFAWAMRCRMQDED